MRLDVSPTHDSHGFLRWRKVVTMEEPSCKRHGSAWLRYDARIVRDATDRSSDFVFCHSDDVIDIFPYVLEVKRPHGLRAQAVGQGARHAVGGKLYDLALAETLLRVVGKLGFHADNFRSRSAELDGAGYTADLTSAADRHKNELDVWAVFENLEAYGSLASNDVLVVVGRHDGVAMLARQLLRLLHAVSAPRTDENDFRSQCGRTVDLDPGSIAWHDDDRFYAHGAGSVCDALSVVSAGV